RLSLRQVRLSQIIVRLHLRESAHRALKLVAPFGTRIEVLRLGSRRDHQFNAAVVKLVNQPRKTPDSVCVPRTKYGNARNNHSVVAPLELYIVRLATWAIAHLRKVEPRDASRMPARANDAIFDLEVAAVRRFVACDPAECLLKMLFSITAHMVDARALE